MIHIDELLDVMVSRGASDLHVKAGSPPYVRVDGTLDAISEERLTDEDTKRFIESILDEEQAKRFRDQKEIDLSYGVRGLGRFRTNIFHQRGSIAMVMRRISSKILKIGELQLPPIINEICEIRRGLVLVTGTTGSGKSTTLAAMVDYINEKRSVHIVTLEDPIEYLHTDKKSVINQREIYIDTDDFKIALKSMMRQDPDVILIGEMRDAETFQAAVSAAETGHLVFSTLHTTNAMQTIDRIIDLFPANQQDQVRSQLALQLKAVICQRLLPKKDGEGRVPAVEIMLADPAMRKLIKDNEITRIPMAILNGREQGMQTFNDSLKFLFEQELVTKEEALAQSDNPDELNMLMQGIYLSVSRGSILKK